MVKYEGGKRSSNLALSSPDLCISNIFVTVITQQNYSVLLVVMATLGKEEGFYAVALETKHQHLVCQRAVLHHILQCYQSFILSGVPQMR